MTKQPIFNAPLIVILIFALVTTIHVGRQLLSVDADLWFLLSTAFIPARFEPGGTTLPGGEGALYWSWLTHMFIHGDVMHLAFNSAWLLVFGTPIAVRFGPTRFLLFFAATGLAGVTAFYALNVGLLAPVVGASGAISGLMGGVMRIMFSAIEQGGIRALRRDPASIRPMTLLEALRDRRVLAVTAATLLLNALAAFGFGIAQGEAGIAWEAHIGGYIAGLISFSLFDRPRPNAAYEQPSDTSPPCAH